MIDIHTHILYCVDDGGKNLRDSIELLEEAKNAGFNKIIFTSHYMEGYFEVESKKREKKLTEIGNAKNVDVDIYLGNEVFLTKNIIKLLKEKKAVSLNNTKYVLFELPFNSKPMDFMDNIFLLQSNNYVPILAHPERYSYFYHTPEIYEELVKNGVLLQTNFGSYIGQYGNRAKIMAEKLLKSNLVHFIASDVHRTNTIYPEIPKIVEYLISLVGKEKINELTMINPELLIENKDIEVEKYFKVKYNLFEKRKMKKM